MTGPRKPRKPSSTTGRKAYPPGTPRRFGSVKSPVPERRSRFFNTTGPCYPERRRKRPLSDLEKQGLIQAFEFTHELAWNIMKDYFTYQGNPDLAGSRDAAREAFRNGLVADGEGWMAMIQSRNQSSHTHNRATAEAIVLAVVGNLQEFVGKAPDFPHLQGTVRSVVKLDKC